METPAHFSFNGAYGAIRKLSFGLSIQSHSNREAGVFLPDDLNASDGFTPRDPCAYRKSNPGILMVQSAQDRMADNASGCLGGA
jgi:hypothetical protein